MESGTIVKDSYRGRTPTENNKVRDAQVEEQKVGFRVLKDDEKEINTTHVCTNQEDRSRKIADNKVGDQSEVQTKKFEDHTLVEFVLMKGDSKEVYRKGVFEKYVAKDVAQLLGYLERNKPYDKINLSVVAYL